MKKKINCTFIMSGTYTLESNSVYAAWREAHGNLPLPPQREYVPDSLEVDFLDACMLANGWEEEEVEDLATMTRKELTQEINRRCELGIETVRNEGYTTTRLKEFLLDYYGAPYTPPKTTQPQPEQSSPERDVYAVLRSKNKAMDIKVYESIDDAKKYVKTDLQAEKKSLGKKGIEPEIISSDELLFTQLLDQDSNYFVYWKIIPTGLIPNASPDIFSPAPQPVAGEQNKNSVVSTDIRLETPVGAIIAREGLLDHGVWIDLRRPDAGDDLTLAYVGPALDDNGICDGLKVEINGCGRKNQESKTIIFDRIEKGFQWIHSITCEPVLSGLRIQTSIGDIIVSTFGDDGIRVDLWRSDITKKMLLMYVSYAAQNETVRAVIMGAGRKNHDAEIIPFDGISSPAPQPAAVEQNENLVVSPNIRVETPVGALIAREDLLSDGVRIDLRRPGANDDLTLLSVGHSFDEDGDHDGGLSVCINGEGRKNQRTRVFDFEPDELFQKTGRITDKSVLPRLQIPTSMGKFVVRTIDGCGLMVEFWRSDAAQKIPLVLVSYATKESTVCATVMGIEEGEIYTNKNIFFDGIENYSSLS